MCEVTLEKLKQFSDPSANAASPDNLFYAHRLLKSLKKSFMILRFEYEGLDWTQDDQDEKGYPKVGPIHFEMQTSDGQHNEDYEKESDGKYDDDDVIDYTVGGGDGGDGDGNGKFDSNGEIYGNNTGGGGGGEGDGENHYQQGCNRSQKSTSKVYNN